MEVLTVLTDHTWFLALIAVACVVIITILTVAYKDGREISLWPPKIGPSVNTPDVSRKKVGEQPQTPPTQAAALCYRFEDGHIKILLVKGSNRRWTLPKGKLRGESELWRVAEINALEEGGVSGLIDKSPITSYLHWKQELKINEGDEWQIFVFGIQFVAQTKPIEAHRSPQWFTLAEAKMAHAEGREKKYAIEFAEMLDKAHRYLINK